jgi:hypothetical protein
MAERNAGTPAEKRIAFRVGINLRDVIAERDDIYGDGVNIAARLEALAEPGGVCISRVVRDQIRDKLPYAFEDNGEQSVKNIARPVRAFALRPETIAAMPMPDAVPIREVGSHAVRSPEKACDVLEASRGSICTNDGAWRRVARSRERPCLAVQAHCKKLPSDHGQRAGISKLNPRRRGDPLSLLALQADRN